MLLVQLGASFLGNLITGIGVIRACGSIIQAGEEAATTSRRQKCNF